MCQILVRNADNPNLLISDEHLESLGLVVIRGSGARSGTRIPSDGECPDALLNPATAIRMADNPKKQGSKSWVR